MRSDSAMTTLIVSTLLVSIALFAAMIAVQSWLGLKPFELGVNPTFPADELVQKIAANSTGAARTIVPLLYPLDLLFMIFMAAFMVLLSLHGAGGTVAAPWLLVLPVLYLAADFSENALYAYLLANKEAVAPGNVTVLQWITRLKWGSAFLAFLQTVWALTRCLSAR